VILSRVLSVIAAAGLVAAFAFALILSPTMPLAVAIAGQNHTLLVNLDLWFEAHARWAWLWVVQPVLLRPVWLVPLGIGLVSLGAVLTFARRKPVPNQHRRRS